MRYTERLLQIVKNTMTSFERIKNAMKEAEKSHKNGDITDKRYGSLLNDLRKEKDTLMINAQNMITEIKDMYRLSVWSSTIVYGEMLHEDAKLLQIEGFKLSALQFTALVQRHQDNPLMMQLLYNYKQKDLKLYKDKFVMPDEKINAFSQYAGIAASIVANPDDKMKYAMFLDGYGQTALEVCTEHMPEKRDDAE